MITIPSDEDRRSLVLILERILGDPRRDYDGARQRAFEIIRGRDEQVAYCGLCAARYATITPAVPCEVTVTIDPNHTGPVNGLGNGNWVGTV